MLCSASARTVRPARSGSPSTRTSWARSASSNAPGATRRERAPRKKTKGVVTPRGSLGQAARPPAGRVRKTRSGLPTSDIQQMLRAGRSTKSVAAAAKTLSLGSSLAEPVITERIGVVRLAQRAVICAQRLGTWLGEAGPAEPRGPCRASTDTIEGLDDAWDTKMYASAGGTWRIWVRLFPPRQTGSPRMGVQEGIASDHRGNTSRREGLVGARDRTRYRRRSEPSEDGAVDEAPRRAPRSEAASSGESRPPRPGGPRSGGRPPRKNQGSLYTPRRLGPRNMKAESSRSSSCRVLSPVYRPKLLGR